MAETAKNSAPMASGFFGMRWRPIGFAALAAQESFVWDVLAFASWRSRWTTQACSIFENAKGLPGRSSGFNESIFPSKLLTFIGKLLKSAMTDPGLAGCFCGDGGGAVPVKRNHMLHPSEYISERKSIVPLLSCSGLA